MRLIEAGLRGPEDKKKSVYGCHLGCLVCMYPRRFRIDRLIGMNVKMVIFLSSAALF